MLFDFKFNLSAVTLLLLVGAVHGETLAPEDMSLEDLLKVQVISTPKFALNAEFTPSAVSVLTRQEIRAYGWRTIADALRTLNGYTVTNDHTYNYVGARGVSAPGDYRSRLQVLIDGIPINENVLVARALMAHFRWISIWSSRSKWCVGRVHRFMAVTPRLA